MSYRGLPVAPPGLRVGLLGGSFDPAHDGHAHITRETLKRLRLDRIWWLVSPGNPLKPAGPAPMADRLARARGVMDHPRVTVSDLEARLGTHYTAETLARLRALYPGVRFVWLMGADNLADFHRWRDWERIMRTVPVCVLARPGAPSILRRTPLSLRFAGARLPARAAASLADRAPPAWCFLDIPRRAISSSAIRKGGQRRESEV